MNLKQRGLTSQLELYIILKTRILKINYWIVCGVLKTFHPLLVDIEKDR